MVKLLNLFKLITTKEELYSYSNDYYVHYSENNNTKYILE